MSAQAPVDHPYVEDIERERVRWEELARLCATFPVEARDRHGYYADPGREWSVKDMLAHVGTWLAQGKSRLERIHAGTYDHEDLDIDSMNDAYLAAIHDQPWAVVWTQANSARSLLLAAWYELDMRTPDADWWLRKVGPDHYEEHLGRLRDWSAEVRAGADRGDDL